MLTAETVNKIAHLARLEFNEQALAEQHHQLDLIMEMMDGLKAIDTEGVEPLNHVMNLHDVMRADVVKTGLDNSDALTNAPEATDGMFQVPRIV